MSLLGISEAHNLRVALMMFLVPCLVSATSYVLRSFCNPCDICCNRFSSEIILTGVELVGANNASLNCFPLHGSRLILLHPSLAALIVWSDFLVGSS